jgi:hypothetical protein
MLHLAILLSLLAGCAGARSEMVSISPPRFLLTCKSAERCYRTAARDCPGGFELLEHNGKPHQVTRGGADYVVHGKTTMVVECRTSAIALGR